MLGPKLPTRNVRFHGNSCRITGCATAATICVVTPGGDERDLRGDRQAGAQPAAQACEAGVAAKA